MSQEPYDKVKIHYQCFLFVVYVIDSIFMDTSMHHIGIIQIDNKSFNQIKKKVLNNNIPTGYVSMLTLIQCQHSDSGVHTE